MNRRRLSPNKVSGVVAPGRRRNWLGASLWLYGFSLLASSGAHAYSGGITGVTNKSGGSGCTGCHAGANTAGVAISGGNINGTSGTMYPEQEAIFTITAVKAAAGSGRRMGIDVAAGAAANAGTLSSAPNQPTKIANGELTHDASLGALPSTNANGAASYQFKYLADPNAAIGSTKTLYGTADLGRVNGTDGWGHAANVTITIVAPPAPTSITPTVNNSSSVSLSWSGPTTKYRVLQKVGAAPATPNDGTLVFDGAGTSTTANQLSPSTTYFFAVYGKGGSSFSTTSVKTQVTTPAAAGASTYFVDVTNGNNNNSGAQDSPVKTISKAMTLAQSGDTIRVAAGTYNATGGEIFPITLKSGVQLISLSGPASTIVDASGTNQRVFNCNGNSAATILEGFTIHGGLALSPLGNVAIGGGLLSSGNDLTIIRRNIFRNNEARGYSGMGGGFVSGGQGWGGAIFTQSTSPTIVNNFFINNIARAGNGINNFGSSSSGGEGGYAAGGGIYVSGASPVIVNNTFVGNQAIGGNGGFSLGQGGAGGDADGGGAYLSSATARNNIFANNSAIRGTGGGSSPKGLDGVSYNGGASSFDTITHSLFFNNSATNSPNGDIGTNAIVGQNPQFLSASDFHIQSTSPARDAGTTANAPTDDIDKEPRTGTYDIGADEYVPAPNVSISDVTVQEGYSGSTSATFAVTLSNSSTNPVSLNFATADGSAVQGSDYTATSGILTFAPGVLSQAVTVPVSGDTIFENPETFSVNLSGVTNGVLVDAQGVGTIINAAPSAISLTLAPGSIDEGAGAAATGTVSLDAATGGDLVVNLSSSDLSAATVPATVTIASGSSTANFIISAVEDATADGPQSTTITATSGTLSAGVTSLVVTDNDTPALTLTLNKNTFTENAGINATTATISRNTLPDTELTVVLASSDTAEATVPASITLIPGTTSTTFAVDAIDDAVADGTKSVTLIGTAQGFTNATAMLSVEDNETPLLSLTFSKTVLAENGGNFSATVARNTPTNAPLTVNLVSSNPAATVPASVTINAGQTSASFLVTAVDDLVANGNRTVNISAFAVGLGNTSAALQIVDNEKPALTISLQPNNIAENGGSTTALISRNTPTATQLTVTLTSNDVSEATVPASVVIPIGKASVAFVVSAKDDALADGPQNVVISAQANGFAKVGAPLTVQDNEVPTLTLSISKSTLSEAGGANVTTATLTRNTPTTTALNVALSSSDTSELRVPASVQIPIGKPAVTFALSAQDDLIADGSQPVTISATAPNFAKTTANLTVTDNESNSLNLSVAPAVFAENVGALLIKGTISLSSVATSPVVVNLSSNRTNEANVPATVTIPAGSMASTFAIEAVDDDVADGAQTVLLSASATGLPTAKTLVTVADNETASLKLTVAPDQFQEGGGVTAARATVTRNTSTTAAITVALRSSDSSEATVPATIQIPAGATSISFNVAAVNDSLLDGNQRVTLSALATGFAAALAPITVLDDEGPTLRLTLSKSTLGENAGTATVTATVTRTGPLTSAVTVALRSNDITEATVPAGLVIPVGKNSATFAIKAVDDLIADGPQNVVISASATGFNSATRLLIISDNESPRLTLAVSPSTFSERPGTTLPRATVTRNTPTNLPLLVVLSSSNPGAARLPSSFVIPAGATSVSSNVAPVDDNLVNGTRTVNFTAQAKGLATATRTVSVTNDDTAPTTTSSSWSRQSPLRLSSANFYSAGSSIILSFSGQLDSDTALDVDRYQILIDGVGVELETVILDNAQQTVTLGVPESTLNGSRTAQVSYQLLDVGGRVIQGQSGIIEAR
jgi:hypothetical protein